MPGPLDGDRAVDLTTIFAIADAEFAGPCRALDDLRAKQIVG